MLTDIDYNKIKQFFALLVQRKLLITCSVTVVDSDGKVQKKRFPNLKFFLLPVIAKISVDKLSFICRTVTIYKRRQLV
jgi:hypothetical protein